MADIKLSQIEIKVNLELVSQIRWLMKYKDAADEALSYLITNEKDAHAAKLMLNALNIGAHEQPAQQPRAGDICHESASSKHVLQVINDVQVCIACGKCA